MDSNKKFWERMAKWYGPIQEKSNRKLYREICEKCKPYVTKSVLELACGTGQFTLPLYAYAEKWVATDFSPKMVEETRKACPKGVEVKVEDATAITYPNGSFDTVLLANALHIMPNPEKALQEIHRVLKDDGILLAPTFVYEGKPSGFQRFRMWVTFHLGFKVFHEWSLQEMVDFIEKQGFVTVEKSQTPASPLPEAFIALKKAEK